MMNGPITIRSIAMLIKQEALLNEKQPPRPELAVIGNKTGNVRIT